MIRRAALIHFREGVTDAEARKALEKITDVLEVPYVWNNGFGQPNSTVGDYVNEYDDEYGGPVWYIP
jgi:hypothetical protein